MEKPAAHQKNSWIIAAMILVVVILLIVLAYAMLTTSGVNTSAQPTQSAVFITITEPALGTNLDLTWAVSVRGEAGGLFEGNVVVQALDAVGNVLAQQPTIINAPDAGTGGSGPWSVDLNIHATDGSQGQIVAFSTSPVDGSRVAEDRIEVGYGESPIKRELVIVEDHLWRLSALNERPPIEKTLLTLQFETFQAAGFGGCNNLRTSYERGGSSINFGFVTSTAKECEIPIGIMAQEAAYFSALEQITEYQIEEKKFTLTDNSGVARLVYDSVVMGNIIGASEIELPEGAVVYVRMSDISLANTEAELIAEQIISDANRFPVPFSLIYNPKQIIEDHIYAIEVRIEDSSGELFVISPTAYHVVTAGFPSLVNVRVESVQE